MFEMGTAVVTTRGIYFNTYYFTCSVAIKEQWFHTLNTQNIPIAFNPMNTDLIFILHNKSKPIIAIKIHEPPDLTEVSVQAYYKKIRDIKKCLEEKRQNKKVYRE